jgi:hypothetical protein
LKKINGKFKNIKKKFKRRLNNLGLLQDYLARLKREREQKKLQEEYSEEHPDSDLATELFNKEKRRAFLD